jgi:HEPN domain-containing protein
MDELTKKWIERARYDLSTSVALFKARKYLYVAFTCQQALEKIIKACIASNGETIPFTHNLVKLAENANIFSDMDEDTRLFIARLTPFAIEARYGDYRKNLSEIVNRTEASNMLKTTSEVFKWLEKKYLK